MKVFDAKVTTAAWRSKPSWFIRPAQDRMIDPRAQAMMAMRAGSKVTNLPSSHAVMLSHPKVVANVILEAASATTGVVGK